MTDLLVEVRIWIEVKAVACMLPEHESPIINYLKITGVEVGLLMNFGDRPEFKRFLFDRKIRGDLWLALHTRKHDLAGIFIICHSAVGFLNILPVENRIDDRFYHLLFKQSERVGCELPGEPDLVLLGPRAQG